MASTVASYSTLSVKELNFKDKLVAFGANDDTKKLALKFPEPTDAGEFEYQLPVITANKAVLVEGSDLPAEDVIVSGAADIGADTADADQLMVFDSSASVMKKASASALKTYFNAGQATLPNGSANGQMIFYDAGSSAWVAAAPSGDIGADQSGAMTIQANAVEGSMIQNGAVEEAKLAANAVSEQKIANNAVTNDKLAGSIASTKLADAPTSGGAAEAGKYLQADGSRDVSNINDLTASMVKGTTLQITDSWRLNVSGGNLQVEYKDGPSWVTKGSFSSS